MKRALLERLGEAFDEKALSIAKVIRSMDADVVAIAAEVDRAGILEHSCSTGEVVPGTNAISDRRYLRIS